MRLSGWGNYPQAEVALTIARNTEDTRAIAHATPNLIARGNGRAYGDAALNTHCTLDLRQQDRILAFDETSGLLTCEAGLLLADLLAIFVPRGWFVPVTPGTQHVTIGGMVAANVHGKNHHHAGAFGRHVTAITLLLADSSIVRCSPAENADLFAASCGGMGLTGIILTVSFHLLRIETAYIRQSTQHYPTLAALMQGFEQHAHATYSVAWIDCLAHGDATGRGILYCGEHVPMQALPPGYPPLIVRPEKAIAIPFLAPSCLLNHHTARAFNTLYRACSKPGDKLRSYTQFFYPLDRLSGWNKLYGRRGFVQYQCVLPKAASAEGIHALLTAIAQARLGAFLAVLKLFGPGDAGPLSFPMEGYTLALDFPASPAVFSLLARLDAITAAHGGRIYLAKDARIDKVSLHAGYPGIHAFLALRHRIDPDGKFSSLQSQRLGL